MSQAASFSVHIWNILRSRLACFALSVILALMNILATEKLYYILDKSQMTNKKLKIKKIYFEIKFYNMLHPHAWLYNTRHNST